MKWIKGGFGGLILCFSLYYGHLAWHAFALNHSAAAPTALAQAPSASAPPDAAGQANQELAAALQRAQVSHREVFVDFRASWCKNCQAMDATVFNQPEVQAKLKNYVVVQYDAEQPGKGPARQVLDQFGVLGLPTYLVLRVNDSTGKLSAKN